MNKTIRKTATILAHIGLLLSILFLGFFIICSLRAQATDAGADQKDQYLRQAMQEHDFSVYSVGKALSDENDPLRENLFIAADLIIPLLCLSSGVLLQLAIVKPRRRHDKDRPSQSQSFRR